MLPPSNELWICFAHVAYRLHERFAALDTGIGSFAVRDPATLEERVGEADVLVMDCGRTACSIAQRSCASFSRSARRAETASNPPG